MLRCARVLLSVDSLYAAELLPFSCSVGVFFVAVFYYYCVVFVVELSCHSILSSLVPFPVDSLNHFGCAHIEKQFRVGSHSKQVHCRSTSGAR